MRELHSQVATRLSHAYLVMSKDTETVGHKNGGFQIHRFHDQAVKEAKRLCLITGKDFGVFKLVSKIRCRVTEVEDFQ